MHEGVIIILKIENKLNTKFDCKMDGIFWSTIELVDVCSIITKSTQE